MRVLERREIQLQQSDLDIREDVAREKELYRLASILDQEPPRRSPGVHVTGILRYIALTTEMLKPGDEDFEDEFPLRMALGMAMEAWFQALWPAMVWQPGEVARDGIIGSIDGLERLDNIEAIEAGLRYIDRENGWDPNLVVHEFKLTWKSMRNRHSNITAEWLWMCQIKAYCWLVRALKAKLHVVWVNGDYGWLKGERTEYSGPHYAIYLIEFTPKELEMNWNMLLRSRDKAA